MWSNGEQECNRVNNILHVHTYVEELSMLATERNLTDQ